MPLAVITGATGGIGTSICKALARDRFDLLLSARSAAQLEKLAKSLSSEFPGQNFEWYDGDLCDQEFIRATFHSKLEGKDLAVVVNNAGSSKGGDIYTTSDQDWSDSIAINLTAPFLIIKYALPIMKARGGGAIINVASLAALQGAKKPSYAATKAGLIGLTKSAALTVGKHGIRVNAIVPGAVDTELIADWDEKKRAQIMAETPLGRIATAEEIADAVAFLASDRSRFITGATLNVTGGAYLGN